MNPRQHTETLSRLAFSDVDVPRPELLIPLVEKRVDDYGNRTMVRNAFSPLARLTPPDRWREFATKRVSTASERQRELLLRLYASRDLHYSMPTNPVHALLPYVTTERESYASPTIVRDEATEQHLCDLGDLQWLSDLAALAPAPLDERASSRSLSRPRCRRGKAPHPDPSPHSGRETPPAVPHEPPIASRQQFE